MDKMIEQLKLLPDNPGVYIFYDKKEKILYVGKAKNLKKRVSSYFNKTAVSFKTQVMVKQIASIKHILTNTESDALLLENSMIKKHQPKYNVLLKDDKTFPWVCIKNERFPRIFLTRQLIKDGSEYIGPFTSVYIVRTLLKFMRELYPIRTCNYNLSTENIDQKKYKICLEYHLGNCMGPCEGKQSEMNYNETISQVRSVLKGNVAEVINLLHKEMQNLASQYKYEEAEKVKQSKSVVVNPSIDNVDVFAFVKKDNVFYINYLRLIKGAIIQAHNISVNTKIDEVDHDVLLLAIMDIRERFASKAYEIIVPLQISTEIPGIKFSKPIRGDKVKLVKLSESNAKFFMQQQLKKENEFIQKREENGVLAKLKEDLRLKSIPLHIECFDNSNIQGTNPVASCVVFKNGKPAKSAYRHFNIKSVEGIDDFASMKEIVYRRYHRLLEEQESLPDLVLIDGGKGQLNAAVASLKELQIYHQIPVIGIAKRLEEIFYPDDKIPLYLDKNSPSLKLLQQIRNEAHRFGITFHRDKRSKNFIQTELDKISGIGEKTRNVLLEKFGSVDAIKKLNEEKLIKEIGASKASLVINYLKVKN